MRAVTHPTARPIARHGLSRRKTSPNSNEANGTPTQSVTKTMWGARLSCSESVPASPAYTTAAKVTTPTSPSTTSAATGSRTSRRSRGSWSRGVDHRDASATNETTSTSAAAPAKSASGIGRSARPTRPWAKTGAGSTRVRSLRTTTAPPERGRQPASVLCLADYFLHFAVVVPSVEPTAGNVAFGLKLNFTPMSCFLFLQPIELTR